MLVTAVAAAPVTVMLGEPPRGRDRSFAWSARPAGFEPATRCLEGSCSVRLSYGRPNVIVHGQDHVTATRRSQCVGLWRRRFAPASANSPPYPNPPSTMPLTPSPKPPNCGSVPTRTRSAYGGTRAQRPGKPSAGEERPRGRGGAGSPRVGVSRRGRIGRTSRPVVPHAVDGPQLRDHAARTIRVRQHRVPVPARDDGGPARARRARRGRRGRRPQASARPPPPPRRHRHRHRRGARTTGGRAAAGRHAASGHDQQRPTPHRPVA